MPRIDTASRLAEILRRQIGELRSGRPSPRLSAGDKPGTGHGQVQTLAQVIARRLHAIDAADPDRRRKAFKVFLESVLLAELGDELVNDPAFYQLVEQVQAQMHNDSGLREAMAQAADWLLADAAS